MKTLKSILASITLLLASFTTAYAQKDTTVVPVLGSQTEMTSEQMLIQMQKQMADLQVKIDQIQNTLDKRDPAKKEIIPVKEKNSSHFYWGLQFGFMLTNDQYAISKETKENLGTRFSFIVKPSVGYNFTPRLNAGCKFVFADCQFAGLNYSSFQYLIANALIGGGMHPFDYLTWNIQPYVRYKITKLFWEKVNLWGELSAYAGQLIPRDSKTHELQKGSVNTIYGIGLRPMITVDLNKNLMLFSSMEFLSWNGTSQKLDDATGYNNSFSFEFIPIYSLLSGLFNIGILRKF